MLGFTNAQGVTEPDLTQAMYAEEQTLLVSLDEIRAQLTELQTAHDNPRLGEIVNYAGFDWIVVHLDYGNKIYYLAMKDIYEMVKFSETGGVTFRGSKLEERLKYFDDVMRVFAIGLSRLNGNTDIVEGIYHFVDYGNGTSYSSSSFAFVPSKEQIENEFDLFKDKQFGRRIARHVGDYSDIQFGTSSYNLNASGESSVSIHTDVKEWWTCTENSHNGVFTVGYSGDLLDKIGVDTSSAKGFRPFICMNMREPIQET